MGKFFSLLLAIVLAVPQTGAAEAPKYVALTFDDGPSGRFTRRLLEGLTERDAKATFFLCGYRMVQYPEITAQILAGGHEIGLHGYSHQNMTSMTRRQIAQEFADTRALLPPGCQTRFLRPPGGACSDGVQDVAEVTGLAILEWSVDPKDWATTDTAAIDRQVLTKVRDGDVVLLHDMTDSSVDAALDIIDSLQAEGFRFVTVSELARIRGEPIQAGKTYKRFPKAENEMEKGPYPI